MDEEAHDSSDMTPGVFALGALGSIVVVGLIGAAIAWARGRGINTSIALAYYFVGSLVFLVGSFPTGGFSLARGRSRRRPTGGGPFAVPSMLLGALLIGIGVAFDITHPF
jgi:hypothetical protein